MNVYYLVITLYIYSTYRNKLVQCTNRPLKHSNPLDFFVNNPSTHYELENTHHFQLESIIKRERNIPENTNNRLIILDINRRQSTDRIAYEYNPGEKTHTFTPTQNFLINKVLNSNRLVWEAENGLYGRKVVVSRNENNEPFVTVLYHIEVPKPGVIGVDLSVHTRKENLNHLLNETGEKKSGDNANDNRLSNSRRNGYNENDKAHVNEPNVVNPPVYKNVTIAGPQFPINDLTKSKPGPAVEVSEESKPEPEETQRKTDIFKPIDPNPLKKKASEAESELSPPLLKPKAYRQSQPIESKEDEDVNNKLQSEVSKTTDRKGRKPEPYNDIKLYRKDPIDPKRDVKLDREEYNLKEDGNRYEFRLKIGSKCSEVKYETRVKDFFNPDKTLGKEEVTIWRKNEGKYPKSVLYLFPNKIVINFEDHFIVNEKENSGGFITRNFDIKLYKYGSSSSPEDSDDSSSGNSGMVEIDPTRYELRKMGGGRYDYKFKSGVECAEIKFLYKKIDPLDTAKVITGFRTVWKYGQNGYQEYPITFSYRNESKVVVDFGRKYLICEKGEHDKWVSKESYLKFFTGPNSDKVLDEDYYSVQTNSDEVLYTLNRRVICTKIRYVEKTADPSQQDVATTEYQRVWVHDPTRRTGYPINIVYKNGDKILIQFEGLVLSYEKDSEGNWNESDEYEYDRNSRGDNGSTNGNRLDTSEHTVNRPPAKIQRDKINDSVANTSNVTVSTNATLNRSVRGKVGDNSVVPEGDSGVEGSNGTGIIGGNQGIKNVKEIPPSKYPKEVIIETDEGIEDGDTSKYKVYTNPGGEFFYYILNEGVRCYEIKHREVKVNSRSGSKSYGEQKVVWRYGYGKYGKNYPESIFYDRHAVSFIIVFKDFNLILFKRNDGWVVSSGTRTY